MSALAEALDYFHDDNDDEVFRLFEQSIEIDTRFFGSSSVNVAIGEERLGDAYEKRATRAYDTNDIDGCVAMLELTLPRYNEAARIYRAINRVDDADRIAPTVVDVGATTTMFS